MPVGTASIHQGIRNAWTLQGIDAEFKKFWLESKRSEFPSLHENEAGPDQPLPYCVYDQGPLSVVSRATDTNEKNLQYHEIPWDFQLFTKAQGGRSAKDIAQELYEILLKKFGGHPEDIPMSIEIANGSVYQVQYQSDTPMREGHDEYSWKVSYLIQAEFQVRVA